jgi:hypothetical protein
MARNGNGDENENENRNEVSIILNQSGLDESAEFRRQSETSDNNMRVHQSFPESKENI